MQFAILFIHHALQLSYLAVKIIEQDFGIVKVVKNIELISQWPSVAETEVITKGVDTLQKCTFDNLEG